MSDTHTTNADIVAALLSERSINAAAVKLGIHHLTLRKKLKTNSSLREALEAAKQEIFASVKTSLIAASTMAVSELHRIIDDIRLNPLDKLPAIKLVLEYTHELELQETFERRLSELEKVHNGGGWENTSLVIEANQHHQLSYGTQQIEQRPWPKA